MLLEYRPVAFKNNGKNNDVDFALTENPYPTWKKLEEMVEKGKVRNIGISKYANLNFLEALGMFIHFFLALTFDGSKI